MCEPLILASGSPRRRELLDRIGVDYRVIVADIDETPRPGEPPRAYVRRMAQAKAEAVWAREGGAGCVLAADTIVVLDGELLGKPRDAEQAAAMLRRLSGRTHEVMTAVVLRAADGEDRHALNVSRVRFGALDDAWIRAYCATGEPLDKAGSYGVQGSAAAHIEHLEGSFYSVMGLPLFETARLLEAAGWALAPRPAPGVNRN